MIRFLILFIYFFSLVAFGQQKIIEGQYGRNTKQLTNYVKNPGCWVDISNITASGGSLARNTTTPLNTTIGADCSIDASASGQTYTWALKQFDSFMKGKNCSFSFTFTGDASLYKTYAKQGTTQVTVDLPLTSEASSKDVNVNFPCGDLSQSTTIVIESTSASAAAIKLTNVYAGEATNVGTVNQSQIAVEAKVAGTTSCQVGYGSVSTYAFATAAACPGPTIIQQNIGSCLTTDADGISLTCNNMPAGDYVVAMSMTAATNVAGVQGGLAISDGTTITGHQQVPSAAGALSAMHVVGKFTYTSAGSRTWQLFGRGFGNSVNLYNRTTDVEDTYIRVYYYPSSSQTAVRMDQSNYDWTAYTPAVVGFGTPSLVDCQHKRQGSDLRVRCKITSGTSTATEARVPFPNNLVSAGTTRIPTIQSAGPAFVWAHATLYGYVPLREPNVGYFTFGRQDGSFAGLTKQNGNGVAASGQTFSFEATAPIAGWEENQNAPLIIGGVTSSYVGPMRTEVVRITNNGTATAFPYGTWVSSVTRTAAGRVTLAIVSGTFSATPVCLCTAMNNTGIDAYACSTSSALASSPTSYSFETNSLGGSGLVDREFNVTCTGPRL